MAFCCAGIARGDDLFKLVEAGGMKVVIFNHMKSPDGRFALGWTIVGVDWSTWDGGSFGEAQSDRSNHAKPHEEVDCVVDLKEKKMLRLPTDEPFIPYTGPNSAGISWGPETNGVRHALVTNPVTNEDGSSSTTLNAWLVTIDPRGMREMEITDALNRKAVALLVSLRPVTNNEYTTTFPFLSWTFDGKGKDVFRDAVVYRDDMADVPFHAGPVDSVNLRHVYQPVEGTITVRLSDGAVLKGWSDTPVDDPFASNPMLKKADAELNQTYAALIRALPRAAANALREEQRTWIERRNTRANNAADEAAEQTRGDESAASARARDKSLLESTRKRTVVLKKQLAEAR
ncbi:MAG TPA: lysozyme inhibitor LprI family protein [Chthoniobacteraceae bacterium]|nr:lysozyme inhibitor LprI family protein [Chthoniobacteraceae bacterium]